MLSTRHDHENEDAGPVKSTARNTRRAEEAGNANTTTPATPPPEHLSPNMLPALQRSIGNAAVVRMLDDHVQRSTVHEVLRSPGQPLDGPTRTEMEGRLGADFSGVRMHTGAAARDSAAEIGAHAYTSGNHVVIGEGGADGHTLAHELTHVIQQRQGAVDGTDNGSGVKLSDPGDRFEREAEANANRVMAHEPVQRSVSAPRETPEAGSAVQRMGNTSSRPDAPPAPLTARIREGEVDEVGPGGTITYPSVTSCLTITVHLKGGGKVGAHASLFKRIGEQNADGEREPDGKFSDEILPALKARVGKKKVVRVEVKGAVGSWPASRLTKAIENHGDGEAIPQMTQADMDMGGKKAKAALKAVIAQKLGTKPSKVDVEDLPDGTLTA